MEVQKMYDFDTKPCINKHRKKVQFTYEENYSFFGGERAHRFRWRDRRHSPSEASPETHSDVLGCGDCFRRTAFFMLRFSLSYAWVFGAFRALPWDLGAGPAHLRAAHQGTLIATRKRGAKRRLSRRRPNSRGKPDTLRSRPTILGRQFWGSQGTVGPWAPKYTFGCFFLG